MSVVALSDLVPPGRRGWTIAGRAVRYGLILAYAVTLLAYLPYEIQKAVRDHWSFWAIAGNTVMALACATVILVGAVKVMKPTMSRLVVGVRSRIEGTELVVDGGITGRVDLATCEARLGTESGDGATVTPVRRTAPVLHLGPDAQGRRLTYPLGDPVAGVLRPATDLTALAAVLGRGRTDSAHRVAADLARWAAGQ